MCGEGSSSILAIEDVESLSMDVVACVTWAFGYEEIDGLFVARECYFDAGALSSVSGFFGLRKRRGVALGYGFRS